MQPTEKQYPADRMASLKRFFERSKFLFKSARALIIMVTVAQSLVTALAAGGPHYAITDLGPMWPSAINNKGQVAGYNSGRPVFWDAGTLIDLNVIGFAADLNDAGQVVGSYLDPLLDEDEAFLWQDLNGNGQADPGEMQFLGKLGGRYSNATAINNQGQVVGYSLNGDRNRRAFLWQNGSMTDLGTLGGKRSEAKGINDIGQVVGESYLASGSLRAFLWDGGGMQNLGAFNDSSGIHDSSGAQAINNAGQVTGFDHKDGLERQFLWLPEPAYGLPAGRNSLDFEANRSGGSVSGMNDRGQVAGFQTLWQNGVATPIRDLLPPNSGWNINFVTDINDHGQIVGNGTFNGQQRGFLLTPPKWTLLFYIAGDNNLSETYWHAFNQLERAADNPAVQVVVAWDTIDSGMEYYHLQHDTNLNELAAYEEGKTKWSHGEPDMGSPATLSDFVIWAMETFPSQYYALILDNHGQGLGHFLVDETNGGAMNLAELKLALGTIQDQTGRKPDVLYMAMCLMGMIEDAYQVREYTDYYVASQDLQYAFSLPYYAYVADITFDSTPADVAVNFATAYQTVAVANDSRHTISAASIAQLPELVEAVNNLAVQLLSEMAAIAGTLQTLSDLVQRFDMNGDFAIDIQDSYADLRDFASLVSQNLGGHPDIVEAAQAVIAAVEKYIIYEQHASEGVYVLDNSSGVSIFLPSTASSFYNPGNYDFATGTQWPTTNGSIALLASGSDGNSWGSMLVNFFEITQPDGPDNPFPPPPISKVVPDERPFVRIRREGINMIVEFGNGILQSSDSVDGLWQNEDISSPATLEATSASRFYRVHK